MNPQAYAIFDVNGSFLAVGVVNKSTPNYVTLVQGLTDGHADVPLKTGNQIGCLPSSGTLEFSLPPGTDQPSTQWVFVGDSLISTPAWPDLTKKFLFVAKAITVTA